MTTPVRKVIRRRGAVTVAAATAALLSSCGSGHHSAASTTSAAPTTAATTTTSTSTTLPAVGVAPLTGLPQTNTALLDQTAVVVKIDNVDQARPQTGINSADIVYEEMVEGGLTRLAAVFQTQYPTVLGPVRSGRLTDEGIADDLNHPVYTFAGTNANFYPILDSQPVTPVNPDNHPSIFVRVGDNAPHNEYINVVDVAALSKTHAPPPQLFQYFAAGQTFSGAAVSPASSVSIPFPAASVVWNFNPSTNMWDRVQNGTPDVDKSGQQIAAANVVILFISYIKSGEEVGEGVPPVPIPEGIMTGSGSAMFLSGGKVVRGSWSRTSLTSPATYKDSSGNPIAIAPGRTWIELAPIGTTASVTP